MSTEFPRADDRQLVELLDHEIERDLILRAKEATEIGVSLGAFARSQGLSYRQLTDILDRHGVRVEKRVRLVVPAELSVA